MSAIAIRVENLSKQYRLGEANIRTDRLKDLLADGLKRLFHYDSQYPIRTPRSYTFWALKDVSFSVKQGEVLGIIGRNGAGKSTLLKILSRITEPTSGQAEIYGRVSSLLEVGTGFQPELTGRDNIYLNGAILGMQKKEIDRKFDEIVDFSGIEKFIDTPIKRYSNGMYVRLAFAVAAHLEPEILIIDEVLAVGDMVFQNKCLKKVGEVATEGRTVLFVSHNMGAIANLCTSVMWIDEGKIAARGDTQSTINSYLKNNTANSKAGYNQWNRSGTGEIRITDVRLTDSNGNKRDAFSMGETIIVEFDVEFYRSFPSMNLSLQIKREMTGLPVLHLMNQDCGLLLEGIQSGKRRFRVEIPHILLYPTAYNISLWAGTLEGQFYEHVSNVLGFSVVQSSVSKRTIPFHENRAVFHLQSIWKEI